MTLADIPAVMAIECRSYDYAWSDLNFRDCIRSGYYCRVLEGDKFFAYGVMSVGAGEAHVLNLCVEPGGRRRGYAGLILADMVDQARQLGAEMLFLEVRPSNIAARSLYEKFGFNELGLRKNYYPGPQQREDALLLARQL